MIRRFITSLFLVLAICGSVSSAEMAHRVRTCTWDGGGADALASNAVNWDTDVAPVAGDSVVFPTTTKACTWDISTSLNAFTVNSGYVQTITQNSGANFTFSGAFAVNGACTITCNAGATTTCAAFSMTTGTFNQGGAFTSTTFTLQTGSPAFVGGAATMTTTAVVYSNTSALTATSGTWNLGGSWTRNNTATFTHHSGTLNCTATGTITDTGATFNKWTFNSAGTVTTAASTTIPLGATPTVTVGGGGLAVNGTMTYSGLLTMVGSLATGNGSTVTGSASPAISIDGSLTLNSVSTWTSVNVTIVNATNTCTYTDTGAKNSGTWTISRTSNAATTVAASTTMSLGANPVATGGNLTSSGVLTGSGTLTWANTTGSAFTVASGGSVTGFSGFSLGSSLSVSATASAFPVVPIAFTNNSNPTLTSTVLPVGTVTVTGVGNNSFTVAAGTTCPLGTTPTSTCGTGTFTVTGTVTYAGTWTLTGNLTTSASSTVTGSSTPALSIDGSLNISATASGWTSVNVTLAGSTNGGTYTDTGAKNSGTWTISKTGGAGYNVAASTTMALGTAPTTTVTGGQSFAISGTLTWAGLLTHTGSITVNAGGTLTGSSSPTIKVSSNLNVSATGTITNTIATVTLNTNNGCTLTDTGDKLSGTTYIVGDGTNKTVVIAASTTCRLGTTPTTNIGTSGMTVNGTVTYAGTWTFTGTLTTAASSTVTGSSTPSLTINQSLTLNSTSTWTSVNVLCNGGVSTTYTDTGAKNSGTWTITKTGNFNFTVAASTACALGLNPTVTLGTSTLTVNGTLTYSGTFTYIGRLVTASGATVTGSSSPTLVAQGDLSIDPASTWTSVNVLLSGSNGGAYTDTGAKNTGLWTINITAGSVSVSASTTMNLGANPTLTFGAAGSFTNNGTITTSGAVVFSGTFNFTVGATGTVSGAVTDWTTTRNWTYTAGGVWPSGVKMHFTVLGTVTAVGITFGTSDINCGSGAFTIAASTTVPLGATPTSSAAPLTINGTATFSGTWSHTGDWTFSSGATVTGTSTPVLNNIEGRPNVGATATWTNPIGIVLTQTSGTSRTCTLAGKTYVSFTRLGSGTGTCVFADGNTFTTFQDNAGLAAHTLQFTSGTTQTAASFLLGGSSGNVLTINASTPASAATLHRTDGLNTNAAWLSVRDITVDARPEWFAGDHSTNVSGNSNWLFIINPRLRKWAGF